MLGTGGSLRAALPPPRLLPCSGNLPLTDRECAGARCQRDRPSTATVAWLPRSRQAGGSLPPALGPLQQNSTCCLPRGRVLWAPRPGGVWWGLTLHRSQSPGGLAPRVPMSSTGQAHRCSLSVTGVGRREGAQEPLPALHLISFRFRFTNRVTFRADFSLGCGGLWAPTSLSWHQLHADGPGKAPGVWHLLPLSLK